MDINHAAVAFTTRTLDCRLHGREPFRRGIICQSIGRVAVAEPSAMIPPATETRELSIYWDRELSRGTGRCGTTAGGKHRIRIMAL